MLKSLTEVKRRGVESLLDLRSEDRSTSINAAQRLIGEAKQFGLGVKDYLDLAIDPKMSEKPESFRDANGFMSGYEAALSVLNLPVRNDFANGVVLDAASDTFQTYPGTRALFPQVVDDVVQWRYRQDHLENTAAFVAQSRTISGVEMLTTVVDDSAEDYQNTAVVAELGRIPVKTIRTTEQAVRFWKHGGGIRYSYEFERRVRLDMLTPYQVRAARELERSKVAVATAMLINGDGVNGAAPSVNQSTYDSGATTGKISYKGLLAWFVARAKAGTPVDTVIGNWDAYLEWLLMFAIPTTSASKTDADLLAATGFRVGGVPILNGSVNFVLSSAVPAGKLIGISKGDTIEELVEANSDIQEAERAVVNQSITHTKTQNTGYKLVFGDTRSVYDYSA